jgi:putative oxidoreductase
MTSATSPTTRSATATPRTALHITLWLLQLLLACFFVMVGYSHAVVPFDEIAPQVPWLNEVPRWLSLFIGYAEIAGGLGLIIPAAARRAPGLTPLAALGLATIMILALLFHVLKGEASVVWLHALVAAAALFVAWGRWRKTPIAGR